MKAEAVSLCRVSSREQRVDGNSLGSQQKHVYDFAHSKLHCEIEKLWSLDVSSRAGKNIKRKDLEEILDYCKHHRQIKYFIVDKVNRLMREIELFFWYIVELKKLGVKTYFADPSQQALNEDDQVSKFRLMVEVWLSEADNKERALTCIARMKDRVLLGYNPFNVHQGYRKSETPGLHEPDPIRFPLLQKAIREVISCEFTPSEALRRLNDPGYTNLSGRRLKIDKFMKILKDPYYAGIVHIKTWDIQAKGLHLPMITSAEYEQLQLIINRRQSKYLRKKNNPDFPLNKTFCECGGKIVGFVHNNGNGWKAPKYRCRSCGKQFKRDLVHGSLNYLLADIKTDSNMKNDFEETLKEIWQEEQKNNYILIANLEKRLIELQEEKSNLVRALAKSPELEQDFKDSIENVKKDISNTESQIQDAKSIEKDLVEFISFGIEFTDNLRNEWWNISHENREKCKQLLFPQDFYVNHDQKVYTPQISPIYRLITTKKDPRITPESLLVELGRIALPSKKLFDKC